MFTEKQKESLSKKRKNSYDRKVLSQARKKALRASQDLGFLSKLDLKTRENILEPFVLTSVKRCLEAGKVEFTLRTRRSDSGKVTLRKGLPWGEKKRLKASGQENMAKMFDGQVMVQCAGVVRDSSGAPIRKDLQQGFAYDLLSLIHDQLRENSRWQLGPKAVLTINNNNGDSRLSQSPSFQLWSYGALSKFDLRSFECLTCVLQKDPKAKHIVLMRY
jgi:hypothetical protein